MDSTSKNRIAGLDGLRAISILLVLSHHLLFLRDANGEYENHFPAGSYGVTVFFVISGFLITTLLCVEERKHGKISLKGFYYRRAFRILPPALAYLAITSPISTRADLWRSVFFVRNFFPLGNVNAHFWSLSVEEQFYFIWPALFILLRNNRTRLYFTGTLLILMPLWRALAKHEVGGQIHTLQGYPFPHAGLVAGIILVSGQFPILAGCFLGMARREGWLQSKWLLNPSVVLASVAAASFLAAKDSSAAVVTILFAIIINWAVSQHRSFLDWKPLVWIGVLSYSLYLWQQLFCFESPLPYVGRFPLNLVASFTAALISYFAIEKPSLRLRDWISAQRRMSLPVASGGAIRLRRRGHV